MIYHNKGTCKVSPQYGAACGWKDSHVQQRLYHTDHIYMVSHQYEYGYEISNSVLKPCICHTGGIHTFFFHHQHHEHFSYVTLKFETYDMIYRIGCICVVAPLCGMSCDISAGYDYRNLYYILYK